MTETTATTLTGMETAATPGPDEGPDQGPDEPRVPWWNIESPLRRRIKGRYVRRAAIAVAALNVVLLTCMIDADRGASATPPDGLRMSLALPASDPLHRPLARMASVTP